MIVLTVKFKSGDTRYWEFTDNAAGNHNLNIFTSGLDHYGKHVRCYTVEKY